MKRPDPHERGQSAAEFTLVAPVLILLLFGITMSAFYAFRAASADWGIFIAGVAEGVYKTPATKRALETVVWPDVAGGISTGPVGADSRKVRAGIHLISGRPWVFEVKLMEAHQGTAFFRLWRFYPGPPGEGAE